MTISLFKIIRAHLLVKKYPKNTFVCNQDGRILAWKTDQASWASCRKISDIPEPLIVNMATELLTQTSNSKTTQHNKKHRNDLFIELHCTPLLSNSHQPPSLFIFCIDHNTSFYSDLDRLKHQLVRSEQNHCQFFFQLDNSQRLSNHDSAFFELCMQHKQQSGGLIGKLLTDVLPHSLAAEMTYQSSLVSETEFIANNQLAITTQGETKLYLIRTLPLKSHEGDCIIGSISIGQPTYVSDEQQTSVSDPYENNLIAELPALVYWKDKEQSIVGCNRELIHYLHDYPSDSSELTLNKNEIYQHMLPQEVRLAKGNDRRVLSAGKMMTFEEPVTINGTKTIFLSYKKPLLLDGKVMGSCGISVDITPYVNTIDKLKQENSSLSNELVRLQRKNKQATEDFNWVIDQLPGNIFWENKDGIFLGCNQYLVDWLGLESKDQLIGKNLFDITHVHNIGKETLLEVRKNDLHIIKTKKPLLVEEKVHRHGKEMTFLSHKSPVIEAGECVGIIGVALDITVQKELEKQLEYAHQEKSNFIANISHDLRTPLHTLYGTAEQLEQSTHLPEQEEKIQTLVKCSQLILRLVDNVLHFSQLSDGALQLYPKKADLNELIDSIIITFKPLAKQKDIQLDHDIQVAHHMVNVDPNALSRILINLIQNAMKHTTAGSIHLKVTEKASENTLKPIFEFVITDTGSGIAAEELPYIFSRFYQGQKDKGNGLGLGLSITQRFIDLMSGTISVESERGSGSCFTCSIPMQLHHEDPDEQTHSTSYQNLTILLVEDNRLVQTMTVETFKKQGWEYDVASTGEEALILWRKKQFDAILLDLGLPDQSGLDVLIKIRQSDLDLPIITLTGDSSEETKAKCFEAGATTFLEKPASQKVLIETVTQVLSQ